MKMLAVLLALSIAALPVPAGACVMGGAGAAQDAPAATGHDCCPGETAETPAADPAPGDGHCGSCVAPGSAVPSQFAVVASERPQFRFAPLGDSLAPSHDSPPFRPPIS
jgi:hypothetical protein